MLFPFVKHLCPICCCNSDMLTVVYTTERVLVIVMTAQVIFKSNQPVPLLGLPLIRNKWLWSKVKQKQPPPQIKAPLNKTSVNFSSCTWLTSFTCEGGIVRPQSPRVCSLGDAKLQRENISVWRSKRTMDVEWLQGGSNP